MAGLARLRQEGLEFKIISPCYINSFPPNKDINKHLKILKLIFFFGSLTQYLDEEQILRHQQNHLAPD